MLANFHPSKLLSDMHAYLCSESMQAKAGTVENEIAALTNLLL